MIKCSILLVRHPDLTREEFVTRHREKHAPLFMSVPVVQQYVRKYTQQHVLGISVPGVPDTGFDGVTELWFDEVDGIMAVFSDAEYLRVIRPDEEQFLDLSSCRFLITQSTDVA